MPRIEAVEFFGEGQFTPIVLVAMSLGGITHTYPAMIDSGASSTIIPASHLDAHGLAFEDLGAGPPAVGMGGLAETRTAPGTLTWSGVHVASELVIAHPDRQLPCILLGLDDFFRRVRVRFEWDRQPPVVHISVPRARARRTDGAS